MGDDEYLIRDGVPADAEQVAELNAAVQDQGATGGRRHPGIAAWVHDLFAGHPVVRPADWLLAEHVATGAVACGMVRIRQTWACGEVTLPVIQIEAVATDPAHRGRRLTHRLFEEVHRRGAAGDVALHMIEGIPYFYRRFGYDYGVRIAGAPTLPFADLPEAVPDGPVTVRPATPDDAVALAGVDDARRDATDLFCPRDIADWRWEIDGRRSDSEARRRIATIEVADRPVGYLVHSHRETTPGSGMVVFAVHGRAELPWAAAVDPVLGHLRRAFADVDGTDVLVVPAHDPDHPFTPALGARATVPRRPRPWYVRADDHVALLRRWLPALRRRLAHVDWPEPTLRIDTYHRGIELVFDDGGLVDVRPAPRARAPMDDPAVHAAIPPAALTQLALGRRTFDDTVDHWPDLRARPDAEPVLAAAFPRLPHRLWSYI